MGCKCNKDISLNDNAQIKANLNKNNTTEKKESSLTSTSKSPSNLRRLGSSLFQQEN